MAPTLWLKNENEDVWDLRPASLLSAAYASFFKDLDGTGFETKLSFARVKYDFVVTEETPQQVPIKGTMYFRDPLHMRRFGEFVGDYSKPVRIYYDPEGRIDPRSQIDRPWYKIVRITKLSSGEQDKSGYWTCAMTFTPLSVMWRRDTTIASTTSLIVGDPHVFPYVYPYFYQSERKLYLGVLNDGERIGCRVSIKNTGASTLERLEWTASSGDIVQYAKWLSGIGLTAGRTLVVDSNPSTQEASVYFGENSKDDISDYQEANPQFINFIELYPGNNMVVFNLGTVDGVDIDVSYTEQVRVL